MKTSYSCYQFDHVTIVMGDDVKDESSIRSNLLARADSVVAGWPGAGFSPDTTFGFYLRLHGGGVLADFHNLPYFYNRNQYNYQAGEEPGGRFQMYFDQIWEKVSPLYFGVPGIQREGGGLIFDPEDICSLILNLNVLHYINRSLKS